MINPVALEIGPLTIYWYGILISAALAIGTILAYIEAERQGVDQDDLLNVILMAVPAALIGARLYYVIFNWGYYGKHLVDIIAVWKGGLAIHGGIIFGLLSGWWAVKRYRISFGRAADIVAPSLVLGQAIGRWGNYFNQEAYGYQTNLPWAMYIAGAYRHPTFLYESIWNLLVFVFLLWFRRRKGLHTGDVFLAYLGLYSVGRLVVEGFRTDSLMLGPLRVAQVVSLALILLAVGMIVARRRRRRRSSSPLE